MIGLDEFLCYPDSNTIKKIAPQQSNPAHVIKNKQATGRVIDIVVPRSKPYRRVASSTAHNHESESFSRHDNWSVL